MSALITIYTTDLPLDKGIFGKDIKQPDSLPTIIYVLVLLTTTGAK